jgi:hydrogenase nickel incorporation protein HypA/HybF
MHELSLVRNILEIALDTARKHGVERISAVEVEVGKASGVVQEALEFAWEATRKGTLLDSASLVIKSIPLQAVCRKCGAHFQPDELFDPCPECAEVSVEIIAGKELRVVAIEI